MAPLHSEPIEAIVTGFNASGDAQNVASGFGSLYEMLNLLFGGFYHSFATLNIFEQRIEFRITSGKGSDEIEDELLKDIKERLSTIKGYCTEYDLVESEKYIRSVEHWFSFRKSNHEMLGHIRSLKEIVENEGMDRFVFHCSILKSDLLKNEFPRWVAVKKYSSITEEVKSAINCLAIDQPTAAIFHLMRVVELGLRSLARERRVKVPKKPIEWAEWQDIINGIRGEVEKIAKKRRGPARDKALEFYRGALGEFESFKDVYRNNVMHVRKTYDEYQANSVLVHTRDFMNRLSEYLGDDVKKSIRWGIR